MAAIHKVRSALCPVTFDQSTAYQKTNRFALRQLPMSSDIVTKSLSKHYLISKLT